MQATKTLSQSCCGCRRSELRYQEFHHRALICSAGFQAAVGFVQRGQAVRELRLRKFSRLLHRHFRGIRPHLEAAGCLPSIASLPAIPAPREVFGTSRPARRARPARLLLLAAGCREIPGLRRLARCQHVRQIPHFIFSRGDHQEIDVRSRDLSPVARIGGKFFEFRANRRRARH